MMLDFLRQMARDAFAKHLISTASSLAEEIVRLPGYTFEDQLFYASCLYYNQEHRRCLALLEHKNMLSAELLLVISDLVRGSSNSSATSTFTLNNGFISFLPAPGQAFASSSLSMLSMPSEVTSEMVHININSTLSTILLAAQCLTALEQYEDSVLLLEALIAIDTDSNMADAIKACRKITLICSSESSNAKLIAAPTMETKVESSSSLCIINPMAGIYNIAGKCYDNLDNIDCARKCYSTAVSVDPACIEAAETLVFYSHLSIPQKKSFFESLDFSGRLWLKRYYQSLFLSDVDLTDSTVAPVATTAASGVTGQVKSSQKKIYIAAASTRKTPSASGSASNPSSALPPLPESTSSAPLTSHHTAYDVPAVGITNLSSGSLPQATLAHSKGVGQSATEGDDSADNANNSSAALNTSSLIRLAEYLLDRTQRTNEAYRFARQAYIQDPFNRRGVLIYIACLVELALTAELFYLGHELTQLHPKQALSWYAVGCYYWSCKKYELAQKHFHKCTKIDKRFVQGYIMLGHSLGVQEEREHAVSALRTACRLLPGDHRPVVLMAKELMKTNCISLALHLLSGALETAPRDPVLLNELGVAYLRLDREEDALEYLTRSVNSLHHKNFTNSLTSGNSNIANYNTERRTAGAEIYCNYATVLRRQGKFERALQWYSLSIAEEPHDHDTHAAIGYTYHLMRRFDEAITSYHRALALHPSSAFCAEMLSRALEDTCLYPADNADYQPITQVLQ